MSNTSYSFCRRIVLDLHALGPDREMLRAIADIAKLLEVEMHGLFVEDENLLSLAALPFAREIRLPTFDWHPLDVDRLAEDLRHAATQAQHLLDDVAHSAGVPCGFEIRKGTVEPAIPYQSGDIAVAAEPKRLAASILQVRGGTSAGSLLLLPARLRHCLGPVVALFTTAHPGALDVAAHFLRTGSVPLIILVEDEGTGAAAIERASRSGVPSSRIILRKMGGFSVEEVLQGISALQERLIVMPRPNVLDDAWHVAASRRVPVLLVDQDAGSP